MNSNLLYEFMAEIDLPLPFDNEFISLIPKQRAYINQLMKDQIISSYAVSVEEGKLWTTILAESEAQVKEILSGFPIIDLTDYRIFKLAFYNTANTLTPNFSLN